MKSELRKLEILLDYGDLGPVDAARISLQIQVLRADELDGSEPDFGPEPPAWMDEPEECSCLPGEPCAPCEYDLADFIQASAPNA